MQYGELRWTGIRRQRGCLDLNHGPSLTILLSCRKEVLIVITLFNESEIDRLQR